MGKMVATLGRAALGGTVGMAAMTAALGWSTAAEAGNPNYGVATIAGIGQYGGASDDNDRAYNPQYFYNVVGGQYPKGYAGGPYAAGDTGTYSHSGNSFSGLSSTGTTDTTGNAISAFDSLSGTDSNGGAAAAYAAANLANGSLHATANSTYEGVYEGEDFNSTAGSQADFYDTLTFNVAGAGANTTTDFTVTFNIDGSASSTRTALYGGQSMGMSYTFSLGDTNFNQNARWDPTNGGTGVNGPVPVYIDGVNINSGDHALVLLGVNAISDTPDDTKLVATYQLTGSSITEGMFDGLALGCVDGVSCNWLNTSQVSFQLPTGVSLSSASNSFLTASGTPEPATWAMMLVGVGAVGAGLRGRRARRTTPA